MENVDLVVMCESDVGRVLFPRLPVYLHGDGVGQDELHLRSLADPVGFTQPHLHLGNVETGEDTKDLQGE